MSEQYISIPELHRRVESLETEISKLRSKVYDSEKNTDAKDDLTRLFELFGSTKEFEHQNMCDCIIKGVNERREELIEEIDNLESLLGCVASCLSSNNPQMAQELIAKWRMDNRNSSYRG